jgi:hypothetical protein
LRTPENRIGRTRRLFKSFQLRIGDFSGPGD